MYKDLKRLDEKCHAHFDRLTSDAKHMRLIMVQICANVSERDFELIVKQAEAEGTSKGKRAAELIEYALSGADSDEIARLEHDLGLKDELITQLREETGFLRSSFATLESDIAKPLTALLTEGAPVKKRSFWSRLKG